MAQHKAFSYLLFTIALLYFIFRSLEGFHPHSISDDHSFRQTQTANTVQIYIDEGLSISYKSPVFGAPWSIPFEFPTYQLAVYALCKITPLSLVTAGRVVSILAFLLCLVVLFVALKKLKFTETNTLLALTPLLLSPYYIFWSRAFMIESTALLLSLSFLLFFLSALLSTPNATQSKFFSNHTFKIIFLAVLGSLAACTKITTFAGVFIICSVVLGLRILRSKTYSSQINNNTFLSIIPLACSLISLIIWTKFTDSLKSQNILAIFLTSKNLSTWNFGSLDQRLSHLAWNNIKRFFEYGLGNFGEILLIILLTMPILALVASEKRKLIAGLLALVLLPILIFFNLHQVHTYYAYANLIYLYLASSIAILSLRSKLLTYLAFTLWSLLLVLGYHGSHYHQAMVAKSVLPKCYKNRELRKIVPKDKTIAAFGFDWDSSLSFYSQRRLIMYRENLEDDWFEALRRQKTNSVVAVIQNGNQSSTIIERTIKELKLSKTKDLPCGLKIFY